MLARSVPPLGHADESVSCLGKMFAMIADTGAGIWNLEDKPSQRQENCDVMRFLKIIFKFIFNFSTLSF